MASSGMTTLGFIQADGPVNPSGPIMRDVSQPGVSGKAYMRTGYAGEPFRIRTIAAFATAGALATAQILYTNYRSRNVTFTDDHGNAWANLFVLGVQITEHRRIISGVGSLNGMTRVLIAEWELQSAAVSY